MEKKQISSISQPVLTLGKKEFAYYKFEFDDNGREVSKRIVNAAKKKKFLIMKEFADNYFKLYENGR